MEAPEDKTIYDGLLLNILQREGKIDSFINIVFGFMLRNTDFYRIMPDPNGKLGFPPGVARGKIFDTYIKFEEKSFALFPAERKLVEEAIMTKRANRKTKGVEARAQREPTPLSLPTADPFLSRINSSGAGGVETNRIDADSYNLVESCGVRSPESTPQLPQNAPQSPQIAPQSPPYVAHEEEIPSSEYQCNADTYNGAERESYSWGQTIKDLDLRVKVDKSVKKGKEVRVDIKEDRVKVEAVRNGKFITLVDNALKWKVHPTSSLWTMVPGEHVHINLEKTKERWWDSCFADEPEIEMRTIDCTRPLEDLDDESLATVNKLKFDQMQKEMGKPTSDQLQVMDQLKSGWDSEGSPFKGQPFDPSVLNFGGS